MRGSLLFSAVSNAGIVLWQSLTSVNFSVDARFSTTTRSRLCCFLKLVMLSERTLTSSRNVSAPTT
jgi:hypothetical protein